MKLAEIIEKLGKAGFVTEVENQLRKLAAELPDFRYAPLRAAEDTGAGSVCSYNGPARTLDGVQVGPDCNGCIFGQALQLMGWSDAAEMASKVSIAQLCRLVASIDAPDRGRTVQAGQDGGKQWGEVVIALEP